ncbi:MAG: DNA repair protein RadA [Clostridia bacterium]|nr:DNA repair protein RadA [Clostridia bacterium]
MAAKTKTVYICSECGNSSPKWMGQCSACGNWNTFEEKTITDTKKQTPAYKTSGVISADSLFNVSSDKETRIKTDIKELDRVLGGGIVVGSGVLISGDPGIGKSTILLQIAKKLEKNKNILYISGEESSVQVKMRANRLGVSGENVTIITETEASSLCEYILTTKPDLVMVDSIQTITVAELPSSAGSISQVKESTAALLNTCKSAEIPVIFVGHVNKGGDIAGPKVLEHVVDTVLYFEGERNQSYRILRSIKNRFGSTNEIGVFEMTEKGLIEVENPSGVLLSGRISGVSGSCVTCIIEGTRPILAEIQGLVTTTGFGNPRRMSQGFDYNRLNMLLAILEKRQGLYFQNLDTYLNVVGGMRINEPSCDLAVCMALVSALKDIPLNEHLFAFGEIGLSGEVRAVPRAKIRVMEAARLGFSDCVLPYSCYKAFDNVPSNINLHPVKNIREALSIIK